MSDELKILERRVLDNSSLQGDLLSDTLRIILDEKIKTLLDIDEAMVNALLEAKTDRNGNEVTIGIATQTWSETHWHKIILREIEVLRNLRKELE